MTLKLDAYTLPNVFSLGSSKSVHSVLHNSHFLLPTLRTTTLLSLAVTVPLPPQVQVLVISLLSVGAVAVELHIGLLIEDLNKVNCQ